MADLASFALLTVGLHHASEVPADAEAHPWFAIVQRTDGWHLEKVQVRVAEAPDRKSGRVVVIPEFGGPEPLTLVAGPGLTEGPLKVAAEVPRPLFPGDQQALALPEGAATVVQSTGSAHPNKWGEVVIERYHLFAMVGGERVELFPEGDLRKRADVPQVKLAADLDRDGRLDLLVDTSDHYNVLRQVLFLSRSRGSLSAVARYEQLGG